MLLTGADMERWIGIPAMDPYGEALGVVRELLRDRHSGAPDWLLLAAPRADEGRLVPAAGAVPSGRRIRVVPTAERVRTAPAVGLGEDVDPETKQLAAAHYGMRLDMAASPSGLLREQHADAHAGARSPVALSGAQRRELVQGLRAAHAMEQASLGLLAAMRRRARDEELVHDLALHHKATSGHAERIRVRLDELEAGRLRPLELPAKLGAYLQAQRGRLRRVPEPPDLEEACRFEQAQAEAYEELGRTAERAGDAATAGLCEANRADEVAMIFTLRSHRLRADPGARRGAESPFAAPSELAGRRPRS